MAPADIVVLVAIACAVSSQVAHISRVHTAWVGHGWKTRTSVVWVMYKGRSRAGRVFVWEQCPLGPHMDERLKR